MLDAYTRGADPAAVLPLLSTWLGHCEPSDTYWYLTGTAELLAAATECWDRAFYLGERYGYRNAQSTVIAPTGTIGLLMDTAVPKSPTPRFRPEAARFTVGSC